MRNSPRDIGEICKSFGWEYLGKFGNKYRIKYDNFEFDLCKSHFPPKYLTPSKCIDKDSYAIKLMSDKYNLDMDFSKFKYTSNNTKSTVTCMKHGDYEITYNRFMTSNGNGCKGCFSEFISNRNSNSIISIESWVGRFKSVHGDKYDYSKILDIKSDIEVPIVCKKHGVFMQLPYVHERGSGCPSCTKISGYTKTSYLNVCPDGSNLYIFEIIGEGETFVKIGISKDVERRINQIEMESSYSVVRYSKFFNKDASKIYENEKSMHHEFYTFKYKPK